MRNPVQLNIRVGLEDGSCPYLKTVIQPHGHVRPGCAISDGRAVKGSNGTCHLRYQQEGKRVWDSVGPEADVALISLSAARFSLSAAGFAS
jgi:hypothetical protein